MLSFLLEYSLAADDGRLGLDFADDGASDDDLFDDELDDLSRDLDPSLSLDDEELFEEPLLLLDDELPPPLPLLAPGWSFLIGSPKRSLNKGLLLGFCLAGSEGDIFSATLFPSLSSLLCFELEVFSLDDDEEGDTLSLLASRSLSLLSR